jgi:hypothetical protein
MGEGEGGGFNAVAETPLERLAVLGNVFRDMTKEISSLKQQLADKA